LVNKNLIECMQWQDLPELQHPEIKLGGDLDLMWPSWKYPITLPNDASKETIVQMANEQLAKFEET
jgi:DNA polymerase-1